MIQEHTTEKATSETGKANEKSKNDESDNVETIVLRKVATVSEAGVPTVNAASDATSSVNGASTVDEGEKKKTTGVQDSELHTHVNDHNVSNINEGTPSANIKTLVRDQSLTGDAATEIAGAHSEAGEMDVDAVSKFRNKGYTDARDYSCSSREHSRAE